MSSERLHACLALDSAASYPRELNYLGAGHASFSRGLCFPICYRPAQCDRVNRVCQLEAELRLLHGRRLPVNTSRAFTMRIDVLRSTQSCFHAASRLHNARRKRIAHLNKLK